MNKAFFIGNPPIFIITLPIYNNANKISNISIFFIKKLKYILLVRYFD